MLRSVLIAVTAALLCSSCASTPWAERSRNLENSKKIRVGMTKEEVLQIMGEPLRDEMFNKPDVWYYYVMTKWYDGLTTEDECMPFVFDSGKLIGWGNAFYAQKLLYREVK